MRHSEVFVSYTHDDSPHRVWVEKLSRDLTFNGIAVTLDQWDLSSGADLFHFMEKGIAEAMYVLAVCTPNYKAKADNRQGGGGYETRISAALLADNLLAKKFIPLLRRGNAKDAIPTYLRAALYRDFSKDSEYQASLRLLLEDLYQVAKRPPIGWQKGESDLEQSLFGVTAPPAGSDSLRSRRKFGQARPQVVVGMSMDEVRKQNHVKEMQPLENELALNRIRSEVFGFSVSWALNSDPRGIVGGTGLEHLSLSCSPGGTVQLEIHKTPSGEIYVAGYTSPQAASEVADHDRQQLIELMLLTVPYREFSTAVAIPYSRIDSIQSRSVKDGPYLLDVVVD